MENNLDLAKGIGRDYSAEFIRTFNGYILEGYLNSWVEINKLLAIEDMSERIKAGQFAQQEGVYWLRPGTHLNPVIAGTQEFDPYWIDRTKRESCAANFPEVGRLLARVFTLLCQAKDAEATVAFHSAREAFAKLVDYDERHDAISYAHQLMPLSPNALAVIAADDLLDALKSSPKTDGDRACRHLTQAICTLASIDNAQDRSDAIATTRQRVHSDNGSRFNLRLAKILDPMLSVEPVLMREPFVSIVHALVRPMSDIETTQACRR